MTNVYTKAADAGVSCSADEAVAFVRERRQERAEALARVTATAAERYERLRVESLAGPHGAAECAAKERGECERHPSASSPEQTCDICHGEGYCAVPFDIVQCPGCKGSGKVSR